MTLSVDMLNDRYRLVRRLGGNMGTVWEAEDTWLERTVAVKELSPRPFGDEDAPTRRERVRREAIALAQVEHPVIVTVYDLIHVGRGKAPWIVMGYVPGRPLSEIIKDTGTRFPSGRSRPSPSPSSMACGPAMRASRASTTGTSNRETSW